MATQNQDRKETNKNVPDKDKYTAGGPRPKPSDRSEPDHAKTETVESHATSDVSDHDKAGKWKAEGLPPYAKTYEEPLDEDGDAETQNEVDADYDANK